MTWFEKLIEGCQGGVKLRHRRAVSTEIWNQTVDNNPCGSWWHRYEWIDYCLAYKGGTDYSFAAFLEGDDSKAIALFPLIQEGRSLSLGGNPMVPALLQIDPQSIQGQIVAMAGKNLCSLIARHHGVAVSDMMLPITPEGKVEAKAAFSEDYANESVNFATRVIDLTIPERERWKAVRKSYHQLIRRGREQYDLFPYGDAVDFEDYILLHRIAYPHARSPQTYELQRQFFKNGFAHPYIVHTAKSKERVGATLWHVYKGLAYYASGVYEQHNIAHMALWDSMNDLARKGIKYAELGWQNRATDDKGKAIEFFKRGFGGEDWPIPCLRRTFLTHDIEAAS